MLGRGRQDREVEVVADAAGRAQRHLALPSTLKGNWPLICWPLTNSTGTGTPFTVRQRFGERGGQRNLLGREIDRRHLLAVDADQAAGSDRQFAIGGVDHGGILGGATAAS